VSFVDKLGETLQDAGWFVGAPIAAAFDAAKAALPGGDPALSGALKAVTTGFDRGTQLFFGDHSGPDEGTQNILSPGVNKAVDSLEWVYDNAIAQPLNFLNIEQQRALADLTGTQDNASVTDFGGAWDRADEKTGGYDGKGTSIGREWGYSLAALQGIMPGSWGKDGQFSSLTDEGQRALNEGKSWSDGGREFDITSGVVDATARLFLDPTIVLGKAAKAARIAKGVAAIKDPTEIASKLDQSRDWLFAGFGKRHDQAVQFATAPNRSAGELVAAFPELDPQVAAAIEQTNKGMRAAGKTDAEIIDQTKLITRASMGDADALIQIGDDAKVAKDAIAAMQSKRDDLKTASEWATMYSDKVTPDDIADAAHHLDLVKDLELRGRDYFTADDFIKITDQRLKAVSKDISAAEQEAARQQRIKNMFLGTDDTVGIAGSGSDHPLLSVFGPACWYNRKLERRAARERGETAGMDVVFQSTLWNKGIKYAAPHLYLGQKAFGSFGKMAQPREINVEDPAAALQLDTS
jgi:hypothetical protein